MAWSVYCVVCVRSTGWLTVSASAVCSERGVRRALLRALGQAAAQRLGPVVGRARAGAQARAAGREACAGRRGSSVPLARVPVASSTLRAPVATDRRRRRACGAGAQPAARPVERLRSARRPRVAVGEGPAPAATASFARARPSWPAPGRAGRRRAPGPVAGAVEAVAERGRTAGRRALHTEARRSSATVPAPGGEPLGTRRRPRGRPRHLAGASGEVGALAGQRPAAARQLVGALCSLRAPAASSVSPGRPRRCRCSPTPCPNELVGPGGHLAQAGGEAVRAGVELGGPRRAARCRRRAGRRWRRPSGSTGRSG